MESDSTEIKYGKHWGFFAGPELRSELDGQNIDSLENIIILQHDNYLAFGGMDLWFTADNVHFLDFHAHIFYSSIHRVNLKRRRTSGRSVIPVIDAILSGDYVEFVHLAPEYPPISRKLLGVHAAIAEVLHMIGAGGDD